MIPWEGECRSRRQTTARRMWHQHFAPDLSIGHGAWSTTELVRSPFEKKRWAAHLPAYAQLIEHLLKQRAARDWSFDKPVDVRPSRRQAIRTGTPVRYGRWFPYLN